MKGNQNQNLISIVGYKKEIYEFKKLKNEILKF